MDNKNVLEAQANNLSGLISYQDGSVVSRTVIDKNAGTVTLFAFDQNQGLSEHTAPFDAQEGFRLMANAGESLKVILEPNTKDL